MVWERALDSVEILTEKRGGVGVGITARITEVPELIMLSYRGIIAKGVHHWRPARSSFLQAVNENHRRPRRIELLQAGKQCCICICSWIEDTRQPKPFRTFTSEQERRRRIKISRERKGLVVQCDAFCV